ncbi:uncharacterized protein DS421_12g361140 [Arachis hypogaea]|nr:uncharacterized protein DS421_12g361140 [Arachis hypogaea]
MARVAKNDGVINRLNEISHYVRAVDFQRPRLLWSRGVSHTLPRSDAIVLYLVEAGFGDTVPFRDFTFDNSLIMAFVERWRLETHMFHLLWGEATITLQDVVPHEDVAIGGVAAGCQTSGGPTAGGAEEGVVHAEARLAAGPCLSDAPYKQSRDPPTVCQVLHYDTDRRLSDDRQVEQPGPPALAPTS